MANEMRGYSAYHAYRQGKTFAAYDELMRVRAQLPPNAIRYVQLYLGIVSRDLGKFTEANEALQESLEKAEVYDDQWLRSMAGQFLGIIALEMGDPMLIAHALGFLSLTIQAVGETADAENFLQESLGLMQKIGYRWGVGNALHGLGILAQKSNPHEARKLFAAGSDIYREIGDLRSLTRALCHQGYNSLALDDIPDAQKSFTEALKLALQCDYTPYALEALVGFASLEIKQDDLQRAFELPCMKFWKKPSPNKKHWRHS